MGEESLPVGDEVEEGHGWGGRQQPLTSTCFLVNKSKSMHAVKFVEFQKSLAISGSILCCLHFSSPLIMWGTPCAVPVEPLEDIGMQYQLLMAGNILVKATNNTFHGFGRVGRPRGGRVR